MVALHLISWFNEMEEKRLIIDDNTQNAGIIFNVFTEQKTVCFLKLLKY